MVLGLLTSQFHHEREYYTEIAKRACLHQIVVAQFTPFSIDPQTELVSGLLFDINQQDWVKQQFAIPSVIYNRCTYKEEKKFKKAYPIIKWLQSRPQSLFFNDDLPNETDMHKILAKNKQLLPYLPTVKQANEHTTLQLLQTKKNVLLKPLHAFSTQSMYHISYQNRAFHVTALDQHHFPETTYQSRDTLLSWLEPLLQVYDYTVQPMVQTFPLHIRSVLQKNQKGEWEEQKRIIQIDDRPYAFLFPLTEKTTFIPFSKWKHPLSKIGFTLLQDSLHLITKETPRTLEYALSHLFELELSIVMDANGAVWLYQIETKPTYTTFIQHQIDFAEKTYTAPLHYYRHINRKQSSKLEW